MEPEGLTYLLVVHHNNWCTCKDNITNNKQNKEVYTTQVQKRCMSTVSMQLVCPESLSTKCIRQAANNVGQPCHLPSHQIHRISRGTPPWTACPLGLPSARLCIQHHQSQRSGPSFWGKGTQRWQDGHQQCTDERN